MSEHLLIKFQQDYADEFDVFGLWVTTKKIWEKEQKRVKLCFDEANGEELESYFGTNEALTWSDYQDWFRAHSVKGITEAEYNTLLSLIGTTFGTVLAPND